MLWDQEKQFRAAASRAMKISMLLQVVVEAMLELLLPHKLEVVQSWTTRSESLDVLVRSLELHVLKGT